MALGTAFKAFFAALFDREVAVRIEDALQGTSPPPALESSTKPAAAKPAAPQPARSDAITLLSTLQREARLIDLVQESLDGFSDAQIGAAARDVLRDSRKVLDRCFAIEPLCEVAEGDAFTVDDKTSPAQIRVSGGATGKGTVVHRGWKATQCSVPLWSGQPDDALIIAATEVELTQ